MRTTFKDCKFSVGYSLDWSWADVQIFRPAKFNLYHSRIKDTRYRLMFRVLVTKEKITIRKEMPVSPTLREVYAVCASLLFWLDQKYPEQVWVKRSLKNLFWSKGYIQICSYCGKERLRKMRKISIYSACSRECERKIKKEILNYG